MTAFRNRLSNERGFMGLIALLIAVAIGFTIYALVISPRMNAQENKTRQQAGEYGVKLNPNKTIPGAAMDMGKQTACKANLDQIRQGIVMYKNEYDQNPQALTDLRLGMAPDHFKCADGGEPFSYDSNTGTVKCVHPGHENL